jgi:hypothetical protein
MTNKYLLDRVKELENRIKEIDEKENKLKKLSINLRKNCNSILQISNINLSNKEKIIKSLNQLVSNLDIKNDDFIFDNNGNLYKEDFIKLIANNIEDKVLFVFKLRESNEVEFAKSFILSKFTPFVTIEDEIIIGVIDKDKLKEFEDTKFIPYFVDGEYKELKFFVAFFNVEEMNFNVLNRTLNIFKRFYLKPSFSDKSFVHYSMKHNKIIDFEVLKIEKEKKEFDYIYDMKYPEIEQNLRKEIKNIPYLLVLLDKIDNELNEIKKSKGSIIVVKRILSFIHRNQMDKSIQEIVEIISKELEV